jgi:excisionase family DNA binding protein
MDTFIVSGESAQAAKSLEPRAAQLVEGQRLPDYKGNSTISPRVLTPPEAAALLQVSTKTLLKMASEGKIPAFRAGRLWRFPTVALERWLASFERAYQPV